MATIAFIGLGNMGGPMAANLVKAGHKVVAFDLVAASRDQAKSDGAAIAESAVASVKGADVVITMLPAGKHVLSVWNEVVPFFAYPTQIRKMIYTTNAIESLHRGLRKIIKTRGAFPSDEAATKLLYLALRNLGVHWKPAIEWRAAYAQFTIFFAERLPTTIR